MSKSGAPFLLNLAVAAALLHVFAGILWPFALAFVLAVLIASLSRRIGKAIPRASRPLIFVLTAIIVGGVVLAAGGTIIEGASRIIGRLPAVMARIDEILSRVRLPQGQTISLEILAQKIEPGPVVDKVAALVQGAAAGLGLTLIYLFFLLLSRRMIQQRVELVVRNRGGKGLTLVLERSIVGVETYMYVQTVTGLMIALGSGVVMFAVGLDNAIFWALVIFLFSFFPVLGVTIGAIGPTVFALLQFPSMAPALGVFLGVQAVSTFVGNLVLPKMQADSQNIDPAASLIAVGVWTVIWGVPGAFLAIPLTLALMYALAQYDGLRWLAILMSYDGDPTPVPTQAPEQSAPLA